VESSGVIVSSVIDGVLANIDLRGMDAGEISARVGIAGQTLFAPSEFLPIATFTSILELASEVKNDPVLGVKLGKSFDVKSMGPLSELFLSAPTLAVAMEKFIRYFSTLQSNTSVSFAVENDCARFTYAITDHSVRYRVQDADFTLAVFSRLIRELAGPAWAPLSLDFAHGHGSNLALYQSHFSCPLRFGRRENGILFSARDLESPLPTSNHAKHMKIEAQLHETLSARHGQLDIVTSIKAWITEALCKHAPIDIDDAASDFGMSVRSFQRKLSENGLNFAELRMLVRAEIAKSLLVRTGMTIPDIANHLGYSELSAFCRGFKNVTGETPARYRDLRQAIPLLDRPERRM
jgi:AraC-like DNA-binding protein